MCINFYSVKLIVAQELQQYAKPEKNEYPICKKHSVHKGNKGTSAVTGI
jgi:hypothetical protein